MFDTVSIILISVAGLLAFALGIQFFISRKSQKVMSSLLKILMDPERAKISDASRIVQSVMNDEVENLKVSFKKMASVLEQHVLRAEALEKHLGEKNLILIETANTAVKNVSDMTGNIKTVLGDFKEVIGSEQWENTEKSTERFHSRVKALLLDIENVVQDSNEKVKTFQSYIDSWIDSGQKLSGQLQADMESNTSHMNYMVVESDAMRGKLEALSKSVSEGFDGIKKSATDYETVMANNDKLLGKQLEKMDSFTKQTKSLLVSQLNTLTDTANVVGGQIRLAESSIEKQTKVLSDTTESLMDTAEKTELFVRGVSSEISILTGKFQGEIKEFATGVVGELSSVQSVANSTLDNTKSAANVFADSVRAMATGVQETLAEMNHAHSQLSDQSADLIKMSSETTERLQPLAELIEKYYIALPELTAGSAELAENLVASVGGLEEKVVTLKDVVKNSVVSIADSSLKLEHLSGESRQQMIDLMSDYAKAVDTMQTLNRQMMEARASAPMQAVSKTPLSDSEFGAPKIATADFVKQSESLIEKLHELSVDLTRSVGAEIPDSIWNKYHSGDKTIFSKWFAKMLSAADKRRVRDLFKADAVFRSQATQFVRGFAKMINAAERTDNKDMLTATLLKTDLGQMYLALKSLL